LHRIAGLSVALLVVIILIGASSAQMMRAVNINSYGAIKYLDWLHVEGQWIVDSKGNRIQLRGAACDYAAYGRIDTWLRTYISWMKQTGCNCIRIAFNVPNPDDKWDSGQQTEYDPDTMDYVLSLLQQNGLYAILDCHHYYATVEEQGWTDVLPTYEQDWINCWVSIANRYKNNPTIAIYELANEFAAPDPAMERQYYYDCINAIRATGDNHTVMCYCGFGPDWDSSSQILPNMCIAFHDWMSYGISGNQGHNWFPEDDASSPNQQIAAELAASEHIATALDYKARLNCPIVLGEFGTYNYSMNSAGVRDNQLKIQMAEQYGIPWETWQMDDYIQHAPTDWWVDFINQKLGGAFPSPYVPDSVPVTQTFDLYTFPALPFNIWMHINESASYNIRGNVYNSYGVALVGLTESSYPVVFYGPCLLRVQVWGNNTRPYWGTIIDDYYITLGSNQTWTFDYTQAYGNYTMIYAW